MRKLAGISLIIFLIIGMAAPSNAADDTQLKWVMFSLGGRSVTVRAGGSLSIHPDAPFRVIKVETDSWLGLGLSYSIKELPDIDLNQFHTLTNLLADKIYDDGRLTFQVFKDKRLLGQVQLLPRLLPIDWLRLAEAESDLGKKIDYTKKALDITPDDKLISKHLVDLLIEARRYGEAAAILEDLAAANGDQEIYIQLGELYRMLEEPEHEAAVLSKLLSWDPGNLDLMKRLIDLQIKRKSYEEAAVLLERLLAKLSKDERYKTYLRLAKVLSLAGKDKQALDTWEIAADLEPNNAQLWLTISAARAKAGDKKGSMEAFQKAAQLSPKNIDMQRQLADQLLVDGDQDQAAQALERAYEQNPDDAGILLKLIKIYEDLNNRPKLFDTYERLAELQTNDPGLHYNMAVMAYEDGNYKQALEYCRRADLLKPGDPDIQDLRFELLHKLNDKAGLLEYARQVLSKNPADFKVLSFIYEPLKSDYSVPLSILLDNAIAEKPSEAGIYELRAELAQENKNPKAAIAALEAGINVLPDNQEMLWTLSVLYFNVDQNKKEFEVLKTLLKLNPKYPGAEERFLELRNQLLEEQKNKEPRFDPDPDKLDEKPAAQQPEKIPQEKEPAQDKPDKPEPEIDSPGQGTEIPAEQQQSEPLEELTPAVEPPAGSAPQKSGGQPQPKQPVPGANTEVKPESKTEPEKPAPAAGAQQDSGAEVIIPVAPAKKTEEPITADSQAGSEQVIVVPDDDASSTPGPSPAGQPGKPEKKAGQESAAPAKPKLKSTTQAAEGAQSEQPEKPKAEKPQIPQGAQEVGPNFFKVPKPGEKPPQKPQAGQEGSTP